MFAALVASSKAIAARVGAAGMYARFIGSSCARVAGTSTSSKTARARADPIPSGVMVCPVAAVSSAADQAEVFGSETRDTRPAAHASTASTVSCSSPQGLGGRLGNAEGAKWSVTDRL